jgi:eukaryotic-like serine/threonine-protein kinase
VQSSPPSLSDVTLPRKLGRYELVRLLGEDAVAETYLARLLGPNNRNRWLGFKLAHSQLANDEAFRRAFLYQARIGVALRHPNVVRTYEVAAEPGQCYAVTEFLRGRVLSRLIDDASFRLPLELKLGLLLQILEGLRYIHELGNKEGAPLGLVHRNLSPARVFVGYDGRVRILDTGLARVHAIASVRRDNPVTVMRYSAPEQCLGRKVDGRADLYAVGVMLWEAMAGQPRQFSKTLAESLDARVRNREPNIEQVLPNAPPLLARICQRALAWSSEERYESAAQMYRDLSCYVASLNRHVGQDALSRALQQHYGADIAAVEQLFGGDAPSPGFRGTLTGMLPLPTSPNVVNAAQPPPSSIPPSSDLASAAHGLAGSGRKHWGFRTPGPSVIPISPESARDLGGMLRGRRLLSGVVAGSIAGLIIGLVLRPLAHPDLDAANLATAEVDAAPAAQPLVVAPLMPHPNLKGLNAEVAALPAPAAVAEPSIAEGAAAQPTLTEPALAQPAAVLPVAEPALVAEPAARKAAAVAALAAALESAEPEPAAAQPVAAQLAVAPPSANAPGAAFVVAPPALEKPRFVVKPPEPLPVEAPREDGPFVVKERPIEEEAEALTESARRRAAAASAKRRKRAAEAAEAAREAASRQPRRIDETDPYDDAPSAGTRERGSR